MRFQEKGVLDSSRHVFLRSSPFAMEHLICAQSAGQFDVTKEYRVSRLNYGQWLMLAVTEGRLFCQAAGKALAAGAGEVLLINCARPHAYYAEGPCSFAFVHFGGETAGKICPLILTACGGLAQPRDFGSFPEGMFALLREPPPAEAEISAMLYRLLMLLLADARASGEGAEESRAVSMAAEDILQRLHEPLTVEALAARYGYSASRFTRIFSRAAGMPPYRFIRQARLDRARHLLQTTDLPIQQIAEQTGFASLANFSAAFRSAFGMAPTAFRRRPI